MPSPQIEIDDVDVWTFLFDRQSRGFPDDQGLISKWGWEKGDVLAILSSNCIDTPAITWGCLWAGGIVSPANPSYVLSEFIYHLKSSRAKGIVTQVCYLPMVIEAAKDAQVPLSRIILTGNQEDGSRRLPHFTSLLSPIYKGLKRVAVNPKQDLAFIVFSSGTTGFPKGVMLTHGNIVSNIAMLTTIEGEMLDWKCHRMLSVLPYYHIYGLMFLIHLPCYIGVQTVVMPHFKMEDFCSAVQRHKITYTCVAPPIVLRLAKDDIVDSYDLSSLRMLVSGAAPLTKELIWAVFDRLGIPTKQAYGLSETTSVTHVQTWDSWDSKIGSVGKLLPNLIAKYVNSDDEEVAPGEQGELWVKGPSIFKGYLDNPQATAECVNSDGFFKTGDVGYEDTEGNFFITDRIKELIKYKGYQVAPAEIEGILASHPKIEDVAVVGHFVPEMATEVPLAFVVLVDSSLQTKETAAEIVSWLGLRVSEYKRLRGGIVFTGTIPKSASGKILRRVLKDALSDSGTKALGGMAIRGAYTIPKL